MDNEAPLSVETSTRVGVGIHSSYPNSWGWEVSSKHGYAWGTAQTEVEAVAACILYLQTYLL